MGFPVTPVLDTFNRPDEGPPPAGWTGEFGSNALVVSANQLASAVAGYKAAYWNATQFGPSVAAFFTIAVLGDAATFDQLYVTIKSNNPATWGSESAYVVVLTFQAGNDKLEVFRKTTGGTFVLLGAADTSQDMVAGDKLGFVYNEVTGELGVWRDSGAGWVQVLSRTDITYAGQSGYTKITIQDTITRLDDFGCGTFTPAVPDVAFGGAGIPVSPAILNAPLLEQARGVDASPPNASWTSPIVALEANVRITTKNLRSASTGWGSGYWNPLTPGPDTEVWAIIRTAAKIYLYARVLNPNAATLQAYALLADAGAGTMEFYRVDPSPVTFVKLGATERIGFQDWDRVALTVVGTTLAGWVQDGLVGSRVDTTAALQVAGRAGLGIFGQDTPKVAAFGAGTVPASFQIAGVQPAARPLSTLKAQINWYGNWDSTWAGL